MRRIILVLTCLSWACLSWIGPAWAKDLVVGVEDQEYYPVSAMRDGDYVGAGREILDAFAKARGHTITYRPLPIHALNAALVAGQVDLRFPDNAQWATDAKGSAPIVYSRPIIAYVDGVMVRPINKGRGTASIHTLGTVSGFTPKGWSGFIQSGTVKLREEKRTESLLTQASAGKLDGAYISVAAATYALSKSLNLKGALVFDPDLPHSRDHYTVSSTKHPDVITEFNQWVVENAKLVDTIKTELGAETGVR